MDYNLLKQELTHFEGYSSKVYLDTLGLPTCGVGHLVLEQDNLKVCDTITPQQIDDFFTQDIQNAIKIVDSLGLDLDDFRYRVCVNLAFNLGNKIRLFSHFLAACKAHDWPTAANELQNSLWFTQVGHRGPETCYAILNGKWSWE